MNVVVVLLDSLRKDHVGVYGNGWIRTPTLDALAEESLRFTRSYPESIPTIPARRAMYTGLRTFPFRDWIPQKGETFFPAGWQRIPEDQTSLPEILQPEGYVTAMITDNYHQFKASMNFQRGFDVFDYIRGQERDAYRSGAKVSQEEVDRHLLSGNDGSMESKVRQYLSNVTYRESERDWFGPQVFRRASEYLEMARDEEPFFLVVDSFDPHEPWDPPEEYRNMYDSGYSGPEPIVPNYSEDNYLSDREIQRMRGLYAGEVTMTDRWLGTFLDKMRDLGFMDNTLLMVLSDHGVSLGEHGATGKVAWSLGPELTDIPFFIRHPDGLGAGQTSDFYASLQDIAPTILGMMEIQSPVEMDGQDLSPLLNGDGPEEERTYFTSGYDDHVWARDDDYVMFGPNDGSGGQLYDVREDPDQDNDLAGDHPEIVERMFNDYVMRDAGGEPLPRY